MNCSSGSGKKRKGVYEVDLLSEKEYSNAALSDDVPSGSVNCFGHDGLSYSSSFSRHCRKKRYQKSSSGGPTLQTRTANCNTEGSPNEEHHGSSNQLIVKPGKRQRQFSWQRHRKRRQFDIQETHSLIQCARNASDGDSSYEKPHSGFNTSVSLARKNGQFLVENWATTSVCFLLFEVVCLSLPLYTYIYIHTHKNSFS